MDEDVKAFLISQGVTERDIEYRGNFTFLKVELMLLNALKQVKKLNIDDVSNQRELLIAFIESHHEKHHYSYPVSEIDVNEYLSNL